MQRLHLDDLAGRLLELGRWHHLDLPAIAERDELIPLGPSREHFRRDGDLLHPAREPQGVLDEIKRGMGSLEFSAQYQQRRFHSAAISSNGHGLKPTTVRPLPFQVIELSSAGTRR